MNTFEFCRIFSGFGNNNIKKYKDIFDRLKIFLKTKLIALLTSIKKSNRGRKRTIDLDKFFTCLFFLTDNSVKMSYIKDYFQIPKSTYYYYFNLITKTNFLENIYKEFINMYIITNPILYLITDTFTVKSMDGSEGLGRSCTDRGRKGLKVSLICDQNLVTHAVHLEPANVHDSKIFVPTIHDSITNLKGHLCLADSGYAGSKYISKVEKQTSVKLLSKPKRTSNKLKMSHYVSPHESELIEKKRNNIERLNGNIRNFRGLMIKYTKKTASYLTHLYIALLCITCYRIICSYEK
jgi:transposase